jgi:hypothetical protein
MVNSLFVCVFAYTVLCGGFHFLLVHVTENVEGFALVVGKITSFSCERL